MYIYCITMFVSTLTLINATSHHFKNLLDHKLALKIQTERLNQTRKMSVLILTKSNIQPTMSRTRFQKSQNGIAVSNVTHLASKTLFKMATRNNGTLSVIRELQGKRKLLKHQGYNSKDLETTFLKPDNRIYSNFNWNKNKTEKVSQVATADGEFDTLVDKMNVSDVIKNISKRSTMQTTCFLSERSTCPWYYDDNGNAHCNHSTPIGCDPNHCLLRCHILYSNQIHNNRSIACISTRPCFIQTGGQETTSCH